MIAMQLGRKMNGLIVLMVAGLLLSGIIQINYEVEATSLDWIERIINDTPSAVTTVAIGDADNDGNNEVVIGMWSASNEVRVYDKLGGSWIEDLIVTAPASIYSVAIGDADNDGNNEVVVGMVNTTNELRAYEYVSGSWMEDIIADTPNHIYSVAIGDADNDGTNEVVIGLHSSTDEVRVYKKSGVSWCEDVVVDAPANVRSVAIGDADNDDKNEIIIGMDINTNEVRAYENVSGSWNEDIIADTPNNVYSVAIGDADNDDANEVVVGLQNSADEVRIYKKPGVSWEEDVVADTPNNVRSVVIGDCDNDGNNEIVIGMESATNEVRAYEKIASDWMENAIAETSADVFSVATGDADNDDNNEVVIGMWVTTDEVRLYEYDLGGIIFSSHDDGDYVHGSVCFDVMVTSESINEVWFYLNDEIEHIDYSCPYQLILDTTSLTEDVVYTVKAEGKIDNGSSLSTSINITVNNEVQTGDYITVNTMKAFYEPDQDVSVIIGIKSPPAFDSVNLVVYYADPSGNRLYSKNESLPYAANYIVGLPLFSDADLGLYTASVTAHGFDRNALIWSAENVTTFEVLGKNIHEQLEGINTSLSGIDIKLSDIQNKVTDLQSGLDGMNVTELLDAIYYLNQSIPTKIDGLQDLLNNIDINQSTLRVWLEDVIPTMDANLRAADATIQAQLLDLRAATEDYYNLIHGDLSDISTSLTLLEQNLSAQHIIINDAIVSLNDTIANASELTTEKIMNRINDSICQIQNLNDTMSVHDSDIRDVLDSLSNLVESEHDLTRNELLDNLTVVLSQLEDVDDNITIHDSDIKSDLQTITDILSNLDALNISELSKMISDLALDLSEHDSAINGNIAALEGSITNFQEETNGKLRSINNTLGELAKLDEIINDLNAIDQSLDSIKNDAKDANEVQGLNSFIITLFLALILIVLIGVIIVLTWKNRISKEGQDETEDSPVDMIEY